MASRLRVVYTHHFDCDQVLSQSIAGPSHAPEWRGVLWHDESAHRTVARKATPWEIFQKPPYIWEERDDILAAEWAQNKGINVSPLTAAQAVQAAAAEHRFHPIRDYLEGVQWDGDRRIGMWTQTYLGASFSEYAAAVGARWLIGAIARVFKPGCKNDCALILEGPQGARKSTALRALGEPWFTDDLADIGNKDSQLQVRGTWIIEWAELDSMTRVDIGRVKSFMSRSFDRFRPPYGHRLVELARESVFAGTTNNDAYLRDESGGRRFWPIRCGTIDIDGLRRDRDQLWAEAVIGFRDGLPWWLDKAGLQAAAQEEQSDRYEAGVWDSLIAPWIAGRESVSIDEILAGCIVKPAEKWTQADRNVIGRTLRALQWKQFRVGSAEGSTVALSTVRRVYGYERGRTCGRRPGRGSGADSIGIYHLVPTCLRYISRVYDTHVRAARVFEKPCGHVDADAGCSLVRLGWV